MGAPFIFCTRIRKDNDPTSRTFSVRNLSTSIVEVYWINLETESRVLQFELVPGASDRLNSHVVHEFEIREKADEDGECSGKWKIRIEHLLINFEAHIPIFLLVVRQKGKMPEKILSNYRRRRSR